MQFSTIDQTVSDCPSVAIFFAAYRSECWCIFNALILPFRSRLQRLLKSTEQQLIELRPSLKLREKPLASPAFPCTIVTKLLLMLTFPFLIGKNLVFFMYRWITLSNSKKKKLFFYDNYSAILLPFYKFKQIIGIAIVVVVFFFFLIAFNMLSTRCFYEKFESSFNN